MKNIVYFVFTAFAFSSTAAMADGWNCTTTTVDSKSGCYGKHSNAKTCRDVNVRVRNHVHPAKGTRVVASIVVSDPALDFGNRTIMSFENELREGVSTVFSNGTRYEANVDSRYQGADVMGKYILGTRVGALKSAQFDVAFSYDRPVADGTIVGGKITLSKNNGDEIVRMMDCTRYLKD
jgi:hypothetical protein